MKACIYIGTPSLGWCRKYFPAISPGELPVAGKEWCAYFLDLCSQLKAVDKVYIADCQPSERLAALAQRSGYWSTTLLYLPTKSCPSPTRLLQEQPRIPCDPAEGLLLFWGPALPKLETPDELFRNLQPADSSANDLPDGVYLWKDGNFFRCDCPLHPMASIQEYFQLNFGFLQQPGIYTLPGYSTRQAQGVGRNVTILPNCTFKPPLIIQDDCYLGRSLTLADGVILGKNTSVDDYTTLRHSIVLNNTYLGRRMHFENKIVFGNRVIDACTGAFVDLQEEFLAMDSRRKLLDRFRLVGWLLALALVVTLAPCYLLAWPFRNHLNRFAFFQLLFRIYPQCWKVLAWKANLVRIGDKDPEYAFRFSDKYLLPSTKASRAQGDIYYLQHRTIGMMIGIVLRSLLKRLFQLSEPEFDEDAEEFTPNLEFQRQGDNSAPPTPESPTQATGAGK